MNSKIIRKIEEQVTRKLLLTANDAGWLCTGYDFGDGLIKCSEYETIVTNCMNSDEMYLIFQSPNHKQRAWVYLVYGNDGWDLINNWSTPEGFDEEVMNKVSNYCENIDQYLFKA
jgi:hypothetical protein